MIYAFLERCLAADESQARRALQATKAWPPKEFIRGWRWALFTEHRTSGGSGVSHHGSAPSPEHALADVAAKRAIIARHSEISNDGSPDPEPWDPACTNESSAYGPHLADPEKCPELRALAAIYADRPGYRKEWVL